MTWWCRRRKAPPTGGAQARAAAKLGLADARAQAPEVRRVAASLRQLREDNHFAESLMASMRRRA